MERIRRMITRHFLTPNSEAGLDATEQVPKRADSPGRLILIIVVCFFLTEIGIMVLLYFLPPLPMFPEALLDASFLIVFNLPVIYFFIFRPLVEHIKARRRSEAALQQAHDKLEIRVKERTLELQQVNEDLQQEIIERRQAQEKVNHQRLFLRQVLDINPHFIFAKDRQGRYVLVNKALAEAMGLDFADIIGKTDADLMPRSTKAKQFLRESAEVMDTQREQVILEEPLQFKGGERRWVHTIKRPIVDTAGEANMVLGVITDITELRQSTDALQTAHTSLSRKAHQLEQVNAELLQYTHVVSHDLRAPLRAINNYVDFIRDDLGPTLGDEQRKYVDALRRAAEEAHEMVNDLLEISRIGQKEVPYQNIDMGDLLNRYLQSLSLPENVTIKMPETWPTLEADPTLVKQIFQNLIENALRFNTADSKQIEFAWRAAANNCYQISVKDNGIGIDPRYHEQIFGLFERLHTRRKYEGTGIGLAIARKAAQKLNGTITVESTPGQGSTFWVTLPQRQPLSV